MSIVGDWYITANGHQVELHITGVDADGNLSGTMRGNNITGFWNDVTGEIRFVRTLNPSDPSTFQIYTGYLIETQTTTDSYRTLTGHYEAFDGRGGQASKSVYGWFAETTPPRPASPSPIGPRRDMTWDINANGHWMQLHLTGLEAPGDVRGTMDGDSIIGFWNAETAEIRFVRAVNPSDPSTLQIYTGFSFAQDIGSLNYRWTLTGYFEAFDGGGGHASRSVYGWLAESQTNF